MYQDPLLKTMNARKAKGGGMRPGGSMYGPGAAAPAATAAPMASAGFGATAGAKPAATTFAADAGPDKMMGPGSFAAAGKPMPALPGVTGSATGGSNTGVASALSPPLGAAAGKPAPPPGLTPMAQRVMGAFGGNRGGPYQPRAAAPATDKFTGNAGDFMKDYRANPGYGLDASMRDGGGFDDPYGFDFGGGAGGGMPAMGGGPWDGGGQGPAPRANSFGGLRPQPNTAATYGRRFNPQRAAGLANQGRRL